MDEDGPTGVEPFRSGLAPGRPVGQVGVEERGGAGDEKVRALGGRGVGSVREQPPPVGRVREAPVAVRDREAQGVEAGSGVCHRERDHPEVTHRLGDAVTEEGPVERPLVVADLVEKAIAGGGREAQFEVEQRGDAGYVGDAAGVVAVEVREEDGVEPVDAGRPELVGEVGTRVEQDGRVVGLDEQTRSAAPVRGPDVVEAEQERRDAGRIGRPEEGDAYPHTRRSAGIKR